MTFCEPSPTGYHKGQVVELLTLVCIYCGLVWSIR